MYSAHVSTLVANNCKNLVGPLAYHGKSVPHEEAMNPGA